jgi:hypothetical protein
MNNDNPYVEPDPADPNGIPRPSSNKEPFVEPDQASPDGIPRPSVLPPFHLRSNQFKLWRSERHPRKKWNSDGSK